MKAFQILRNARTTSSSPSQSQSSESKPTSSENRAVDSDSIKRRRQSTLNRKTVCEKPNRHLATALSVEKFPSAQKIKKSTTRLRTCSEKRSREGITSPKVHNLSVPNKLGFPCELPDDLVSDVDIKAKFEREDKQVRKSSGFNSENSCNTDKQSYPSPLKNDPLGVVITKSLLVLKVEEHSDFYGKLKICDFLTHLDSVPITSKKEFYSKLKPLRNSGKEFNLRLRRPLWNTPAIKLPKGYDRAPGYNYIRGLMILYPGGNLGMNVKSYNSKVYVTSTDQMSMASAACLMGDCIVDVDGTPVTSTASCAERVISGLKDHKFVLLTIERAVDLQAIRVVKYILLVEKVPEKDPRMAQDTTKIGLDEADKIRQNLLPVTLKGIYRGKHGYCQKHLVIREMSLFTPIGADPFNPLLMQAVPPKKMDAMHASKSGQINISASSVTKGVTLCPPK